MFRNKRSRLGKLRSYKPTYRQNQSALPKSRSFRNKVRRSNVSFSKFHKTLRNITLVSAVVLLIYALFFSKYFQLQSISFAGENLENPEFTENIKGSLKTTIGKNLLFIKTVDLEKKITSTFSELENIKISKNYPNSLEIEFTKFPLVANVISESNTLKKSYIINSIGVAVKEDLKHESLPSIRIVSDEPLNAEKPLIEKEKLDYILKSIIEFENRFGNQVKITEVTYKPTAREVHLLTARDFYIWLDIQKPYEDQFKKLKKALAKLDIYTLNLEYIDLRIAANNGDRIIYKPK